MKTDKIYKIEIENIKGFGQDTDSSGNKIPFSFDVEIFPNKPNIVVAPNGFGKSSLTAAFSSLHENRISLEKDSVHEDNPPSTTVLHPSLKLYLDDELNSCFEANDSKDEIISAFDVFVINSRLVSKYTKRHFAGSTKVSSFLDIERTEIISTIPPEVKFDYSLKKVKILYSSIDKVFKNLTFVFENTAFLKESMDNGLMEKLSGQIVSGLLNVVRKNVLTYKGTSNQIKTKIISSDIPPLKKNDKTSRLIDLFMKFAPDDWTEADAVLSMIQYIDVFTTMGPIKFKKAIAYKEYLQEKEWIRQLLESVNSTRFKVDLHEEDRSLVVDWPKAKEISNGQRDILTFVSLLLTANKKLTSTKNILVIDEVFDYLDDSNLITFQYQINTMINGFKEKKQSLYPILFTHIDPEAFNHWSFGKNRMHVSYLKKVPVKNDRDLLLLVKNRNDPSIKADVEKYYFHYHNDSTIKENVDQTLNFNALGITQNIGDAYDFYAYVQKECRNYIEGISINPIAVSFALRIKIEQIVYDQLSSAQQIGFINEHGTSNKLDYASEFLLDKIPEHFYLLGLIYNGMLHCKFDNVEQSIALKLENQTIKKMISDVFDN